MEWKGAEGRDEEVEVVVNCGLHKAKEQVVGWCRLGWSAQHSTAQHSTAQHSTAQHSRPPFTPTTRPLQLPAPTPCCPPELPSPTVDTNRKGRLLPKPKSRPRMLAPSGVSAAALVLNHTPSP
jgi:hypothetical protein